MTIKARCFRWICLGLLLPGCGHQPASTPAISKISAADSVPPIQPSFPPGDTLLHIGGIEMAVHTPPTASLRGTVLVFPGWNFRYTRWCAETLLCHLADSLGLVLLQPEMGKSIYASQYHPETRPDYRTYLTRGWVVDTLIPFVQQRLGLLQLGQPNYLLGLSTGARGVALLALDTDTLFRAGIALSGDYDPRAMPNDNLLRNTYGSFFHFPERWGGADNPVARAAALRVPLYLGHGQQDSVVPWRQTQLYYDSLRVNNPNLPVTQVLRPTAAHDFAYWGTELREALGWMVQH